MGPAPPPAPAQGPERSPFGAQNSGRRFVPTCRRLGPPAGRGHRPIPGCHRPWVAATGEQYVSGLGQEAEVIRPREWSPSGRGAPAREREAPRIRARSTWGPVTSVPGPVLRFLQTGYSTFLGSFWKHEGEGSTSKDPSVDVLSLAFNFKCSFVAFFSF